VPSGSADAAFRTDCPAPGQPQISQVLAGTFPRWRAAGFAGSVPRLQVAAENGEKRDGMFGGFGVAPWHSRKARPKAGTNLRHRRNLRLGGREWGD